MSRLRYCTIKQYMKQLEENQNVKQEKEPKVDYRRAYERIFNYNIEHDMLSADEIEYFKKAL